MTTSEPKSKKKYAILGIISALAMVSALGISTIGFDNSAGIVGTDTATFGEGETLVAHYSLVGGDEAVFGDAKQQTRQALQTQGILDVKQVMFYVDGNGDYQEIPYYDNSYGEDFIFGGIGLIEYFECPTGAIINPDDNTTCLDEEGNIVDRIQTGAEKIHNRVTNEGETFVLDMIFQDGGMPETADGDLLSSICVTDEAAYAEDETETASAFDTANSITETNCIEDATVDQTGQIATIGPLTFDAPTHVGNGDTITAFAVCQGSASTPFNNCADAQAASSGILFSNINSADRTLATSETVDITYTFDFSSAGA